MAIKLDVHYLFLAVAVACGGCEARDDAAADRAAGDDSLAAGEIGRPGEAPGSEAPPPSTGAVHHGAPIPMQVSTVLQQAPLSLSPPSMDAGVAEAGIDASSPLGVTCTTWRLNHDCTSTAVVESPRFWFAGPISDPQSQIVTDSMGLQDYYLGTARLSATDGTHTLYRGGGFGDSGTAHVTGNVITKFTASAGRQASAAWHCPPNAFLIYVECKGGNVPIGPH